jgi:hypothetical protein
MEQRLAHGINLVIMGGIGERRAFLNKITHE